MGIIGGIKGQLQDQFIARPDGAKDDILFKWQEDHIRLFSQVTVQPDEWAFFIKKGQLAGYLPNGQSRLDGAAIPFLQGLIDGATGGNFLLSELYFVSSREFTQLKFGGPIDNVQDPKTQLFVTLQVYGEYAVKVVDPVKLILNLVGTQGLQSNDQITGWVREQILKALRADVTAHIVKGEWPVIGIAAFTDDIEQDSLQKAAGYLGDYGLQVTRFGNFTIQLKDDDEARIKSFQEQVAGTQLLGGGDFTKYSTGKAIQGAGEGMAQGGAGVQMPAMILGAGLGGVLGGQAGAGAAPAPAAVILCPSCNARNAEGSKFCAGCGKPLGAPAPAAAPAAGFCSQCGHAVAAEDKFCPGCGHPTGH